MITVPSGNGFRATLPGEDGTPAVSVWARTADDAEFMAHRDNMRHYEEMEKWRAQLEHEFSRQQAEEFRRVRARA